MYEQVTQLRQRGVVVSAIAWTMKLDRRTVYGWRRAGTILVRVRRPPMAGQLDHFMPYLQQRWQQGCHNAVALLREIPTRGYRGGSSMMLQRLRAWRLTTPETHYTRPVVIPSTWNARAWQLGLHKRDPEEAEQHEQFVTQLCNTNPNP
jgi:transposase